MCSSNYVLSTGYRLTKSDCSLILVNTNSAYF